MWFLAPAGKLSSASQSYEALHHVRRLHAPMRDAMLRPTETLRNGRSRRDVDDPPPAFADEIESNPNLVAFLERQFNDPQLAAIKCAAAHTAARNATAAEKNALSYRQHASSAREIDFPFTLVQGPPGTARHTRCGAC